MVYNKTNTKAKAIPAPINQPNGVRRVKTMALILSVIDVEVCPAATIADCDSRC